MTTTRNDTQERFDAKKVLQKISGKRPGKPCGKSFIAADRKCGSHNTKTATGKRKLTEEGKKAAELLAAKVRARKGLAPKVKPRFKGKTEAERKLREEMYQILQRNRQWKKEGKRRREEQSEFDKRVANRGNLPATIGSSQKGIKFTPLETPKGMTPAERRAALRRKYGAPDDGSRIGKLARKEERRAIVGLGAEAEQPLGKRKRELVEKASERFGIEQSSKAKSQSEKSAPRTVKIGGKQYDIPGGEVVTAGLDFNTLSSSANRLYVAFGSNGEPIRETRDPQTGRMQVARFKEQSQAENFAAKINKALNRPEKKSETSKLKIIEGGKKKDDRTLEQLITEAQKIGAKYDDGTADLAAHREAKKLVGETVGKAFEKGKGESKDDRSLPPTSPSPQRKSVADINAELRKKNGITSRKRSVDSADERIAIS